MLLNISLLQSTVNIPLCCLFRQDSDWPLFRYLVNSDLNFHLHGYLLVYNSLSGLTLALLKSTILHTICLLNNVQSIVSQSHKISLDMPRVTNCLSYMGIVCYSLFSSKFYVSNPKLTSACCGTDEVTDETCILPLSYCTLSGCGQTCTRNES